MPPKKTPRELPLSPPNRKPPHATDRLEGWPVHSPSDHASSPISPIAPIAPIAPTPKSNRCNSSNSSNSSNIPTSRPPVACSRYAPRGAPPFPRGLEHAHNHPKNALGKNAEAPSVRALRRSRYERQTALGKNAKALSVRASEPPSDRGMRGVTSPSTTPYPSADRG